jgi:hypothetical protein
VRYTLYCKTPEVSDGKVHCRTPGRDGDGLEIAGSRRVGNDMTKFYPPKIILKWMDDEKCLYEGQAEY